MALTTLTGSKTTPEGQTKPGVRALCQMDLYAFARDVLYAHLTPNLLTDTLHKPLCAFIQTTPYDENLYLLSRGFFKSSIITTAAVIQRILADPATWWCQQRWKGRGCGPNTRVLIASNKGENAEGFLAGIKGHLASNDLLLGLFPDILPRDPQRAGIEWTQAAITVQRSRRDLRESTIQTIGVEGELVSRHYDHGVFDDCVAKENSASKAERAKVWDFFMKSRPLFDPGSTKDFVGCLPAGAEVLLADGRVRPIEAMKVGDRVWSAGEDGTLSVRAVQAVLPQGEAATVTVQTRAKTLRATPNHPFLKCERGRFVWTRADQLAAGDYIVAIKRIGGGDDVDTWLDDEFIWLFGFLMGDGWAYVKGHRGHVGIALSQDEPLNARVLSAARTYLSSGVWRRLPALGCARSDGRADAVWLQARGLVGTAKTKRVPDWIFQLPAASREAFLRGFCDADGHRDPVAQEAWRVEISNQALLDDLRHLAMLCGVRTGGVYHRRRLIHAPNSPAAVWSETWSSLFNFAPIDRDEFWAYVGGHGGGWRSRRAGDRLNPDRGLRPEFVLAVTPNPGTEMVYDLSIEGVPAFFANGLAVHNTHWHYADAYAEQKARRARGQLQMGLYVKAAWEKTTARAATDPGVLDGTVGDVPGHGWVAVTFPERFCLRRPPGDTTRLELLVERENEPSNFNAQYLLNPVSAETAHFPRLDATGAPNLQLETASPPLHELWVAMAIDPAQSLHKWADYSGIAVGGFDRRGDLWLLELWMARRDDEALVRKIFDLVEQFRARGVEMKAIGFEAVGFAKGFRHVFTIEGDRRGFYLPILGLERDTQRTKQQRIGLIQGPWMGKQIHALATCEALADFVDQADKFRMDQENESDDLLDPVADLYQLRGKQSAPADPFLSDEAAQRWRWEQELRRTRPELDALSLRIAWHHQQSRLAATQAEEARALQGAAGGLSELWG